MAKFIQLFRNQLNAPFADKATAKAALEANNIDPKVLKDGMPIIARYETNGPGSAIKTLLGIAHNNGQSAIVTVFDSGSIDELDYSGVTTGSGVYVSNVVENDGIISATTETLPTVTTITEAGKPIVAVSESLGEISASAGTINAEFVNVADSGEKFTGTTVEAVLAEIDDAYKAAISGLDYTDTAVTGSYVSKVDETDGVISVTRVALPDASSVSGESKVVVDVTQDKGAITATAANLTGVKLDGYTEAAATGDVASTDTLGEALGKLQKTIHEMDLAVVSGDGEVITAVSEADGVVSASTTAVKDIKLTGYVKDTSATGDIAATDDIEAALSKLENKAAAVTIIDKDGSINVATGASGTEVDVNIKSGEKVLKKDGGAGIYTDLDLVKITTGLPETIKERYQFLATDDSQIGVNIDVPKDSHIVSITYITDSSDPNYQNLEYKYIDVSGNTKTEYVDMSELVLETEFASGVTVTDGVAHGVVDPTSESFLTVGAGGFKVSGVSGLVTSAIEALDVTGDTAVAGQYVAAIEETDGMVAVKTRANVSEAVLNNYAKGSDSGAVASTDTVNQAISKLENQVDAAKAAATKVEKDANASHLTLTSTTDASGATVYTIGESDVASKSDLDTLSGKAVTAAAMTGGSATITAATDGTKQIEINVDGSTISATTYQKGSDASAVVATDTINEAISKLENQVDKAKAAATTVVTAGTSADTTAHLEISASTDSTTSATTYTVDLKDVASASALTDEIAARKTVDGQTGDTYEANTAATYISGATSLNNADVLLDAALKTVDDDMLSGVTGSNAISASTKSDKGQTISLILDDSTTSTDATAQYASDSGNALQITNDGLYLDSTWDCGFYSSPANP